MRILLTGSSGWLGRFLAPRLRAKGHEVVGLDVAAGADTAIIGSVADRATVDRAFGLGIEAVIHAGALHKPDIARYPAQAFVDVNVTGTLNLLTAAKAAGHDRFVFTSTTSLMISQAVRDEAGDTAVWLDQTTGPLAPRNIYGVTKLAAEGLCRLYAAEHGLPCVVLRTARFFPEDDDTHRTPSGENLKANEFLNRRLTVEDAADAHIAALDRAPALGFDLFVLSAPTPFDRANAAELKHDARAVIARYFPEAPALYARRGWTLPASIGRVYDASHAEHRLGFRCRTGFAAVLAALREGRALPFAHDPAYVSPKERRTRPDRFLVEETHTMTGTDHEDRPLAHADTPPNSEHRDALDAESHAGLKHNPSNEDAKLDVALDETFPTSDPPSNTQPGRGLDPAPSSGFKEEPEPPTLDGE